LPSLSPPSLSDNDSVLRDATDGTPIDCSPSRPNDLIDSKETKKDESKKEDDTSQPSTIERVYKPAAHFLSRLMSKKH